MRIAIDARLNAYRRGGIAQYTRYLLDALAEIASDEQFISLQHRDMLRPLAIAPNVTRRVLWTPPHHRFESWSLPLELLAVRAQVVHFPDFIAPRSRLRPTVTTIHDLAFLRYPEILNADAQAYYGQVIESSRRADAVIAVSEATRQDIAQFCDIPPEEIDLIYEAAAPMFRKMDLRAGEVRVLNQQPVELGTFMLFVSTLEPRKNLPTLLKAMRVCLDRRPERKYRLVIVGGRGWKDKPIFEAVRDLHLSEHVLFAGNAGQYDLRWLYNACRLFVHPSIYEGFGLPLLEAMACGAACLASETSSLTEIGGEAALYVPPLDVEAWADAIEALWDDEERRAELGRIGASRALRFSWQRAAQDTLKVYRRVVERHEAGQQRWKTAAPSRTTHAPSTTGFNVQPPARPCLRCRAPMKAGEVQPFGALVDDALPQPLRAWVCPECGNTELVLERQPQPLSATAAVSAEQSTEQRDLADTLEEATADESVVTLMTEEEVTATDDALPSATPMTKDETTRADEAAEAEDVSVVVIEDPDAGANDGTLVVPTLIHDGESTERVVQMHSANVDRSVDTDGVAAPEEAIHPTVTVVEQEADGVEALPEATNAAAEAQLSVNGSNPDHQETPQESVTATGTEAAAPSSRRSRRSRKRTS